MRATPVAVLPLLACGPGAPPLDSGDTVPGSGAIDSVAAVRDALDAGTLEEGDVVILTGVVATTGLTRAGDAFYVQDPAGGERTGIRIHLGGVMDPVPAAPGHVLDVTGRLAVYDGVPRIAVAAAGDVLRAGTGKPVADPLPCATADHAPWEGGLVTVSELATTGPVDAWGEAPTACGLALDDLFTDLALTGGTTCASAGGVILRVRGAARLAPRDATDLSSCVTGDRHLLPDRPARRPPCALPSS